MVWLRRGGPPAPMRATRMAFCARFTTPRPTTAAVCVCGCVLERARVVGSSFAALSACLCPCLSWLVSQFLSLSLSLSLSFFFSSLSTHLSLLPTPYVFPAAIFFLPLAVIPDGPSAAQLSRMSPSERARASQSAYMLYTTFGTGAETFHPKIGVAAAG